MSQHTSYHKHWVAIATVIALLSIYTYPVFSAESNETDLNTQQVTPKGSTRAMSPAKDDVIYHPPSGTFKTGEELQNEHDRKSSADSDDRNKQSHDARPPMPETR